MLVCDPWGCSICSQTGPDLIVSSQQNGGSASLPCRSSRRILRMTPLPRRPRLLSRRQHPPTQPLRRHEATPPRALRRHWRPARAQHRRSFPSLKSRARPRARSRARPPTCQASSSTWDPIGLGMRPLLILLLLLLLLLLLDQDGLAVRPRGRSIRCLSGSGFRAFATASSLACTLPYSPASSAGANLMYTPLHLEFVVSSCPATSFRQLTS